MIDSDYEYEAIDMSAEHLGSELMGLVLQEIKAIPDVWQRLAEVRQADVIDRVRENVEQAVKQAVMIIAASGMTQVVADLEGVAIKDDIKATFKVSRTNSAEALQALYDAHNKACLLIVSTPEQFTGGMEEVRPDPDQPSLGFDDQDRAA